MLKYKITKAAFEKLDETQQEFYAEKDGEYTLKVDGIPAPDDSDDLAGILQKNKELMDEVKALKREKQARERKEHEENNNWEELKKSLEEQHATEIADRDKRIKTLEGSVEGLTSKAEARKIISKLALEGSEDIWEPHVQGRIRTVFDPTTGEPKVVYLDANGKESKLTADQLEAELRADKRYSRIVRGSNASGAGHQNSADTGGAGDAKPKVTRREFEAMSQADRAAFVVEKRGTVVDDE